jgi:hypothetical protein
MNLPLRGAVLTLAAALSLAACGGGSSGGDTTTPGGSSSPSTGASSAPAAASQPADPEAAEAEIIKNWRTFLSSDTSRAVALSLLENGDHLTVALKKADQENEETGGERSAKVTQVTFTSPTKANVNYDLHAAGQELKSAGEAVLQDGVWKVSETTFCTLVELGNGSQPVKGCSI